MSEIDKIIYEPICGYEPIDNPVRPGEMQLQCTSFERQSRKLNQVSSQEDLIEVVYQTAMTDIVADLNEAIAEEIRNTALLTLVRVSSGLEWAIRNAPDWKPEWVENETEIWSVPAWFRIRAALDGHDGQTLDQIHTDLIEAGVDQYKIMALMNHVLEWTNIYTEQYRLVAE